MRDLFVTGVVLAWLPLILARPWTGILAWSWIGYMNPHRLTWGFAYSMPFAFMVAIVTLVGLLFSKEKKQIPVTRETVLLAILIAWMFLTTVFSLYPSLAWPQWDKVWRIMLMTYVTMMLINDEHRVKMLMYVIALSLGFYGVKGGIFVVTGGSAHSVMGPAGSFIADRNSVGLALIMTVPLLNFMRMQMKHWAARWGLMAAIGLTLIAAVGTHSRGALLGIICMLVFYFLKSRQKVTVLLSAVPLAFVFYAVMPAHYFERMETIQTWEDDGSASERWRAWENAIDLANQRIIGGGMRALVHWGERDSHSIFFGMLGEHGWPGLAMFLLLIIFTWLSASWVIRQGKRHKELEWAWDLAAMVQVSLIGYMSAGAFLGLQYFDLFYHLVAIVVITKVLVVRRLAELKQSAQAEESAGVRRTSVGAPQAAYRGAGAREPGGLMP